MEALSRRCWNGLTISTGPGLAPCACAVVDEVQHGVREVGRSNDVRYPSVPQYTAWPEAHFDNASGAEGESDKYNCRGKQNRSAGPHAPLPVRGAIRSALVCREILQNNEALCRDGRGKIACVVPLVSTLYIVNNPPLRLPPSRLSSTDWFVPTGITTLHCAGRGRRVSGWVHCTHTRTADAASTCSLACAR